MSHIGLAIPPVSCMLFWLGPRRGPGLGLSGPNPGKRVSAFYLRKSKFSARLLFWFSLLIEGVFRLKPAGGEPHALVPRFIVRFKFIAMPFPAPSGFNPALRNTTACLRLHPDRPYPVTLPKRFAALRLRLGPSRATESFLALPLGEADVTRPNTHQGDELLNGVLPPTLCRTAVLH